VLLDTPVCDFGWEAPDFTLENPAGSKFTMSEHLGDKGLLIAFLCNHCPYVQTIAERFAHDTDFLKSVGIEVLAVMSNNYRYMPIDSPPKMARFALKSKWNFPYLVDEDQTVGKAYGAVCTPDFFGLNRDGKLQYRGRLDNARNSNPSDRTRELVDAMCLIARTGRGPKDQLPSIGCSIKWS